MNCLIDPCVLLPADSRCLLDLNEDAGRVLLDLLVTSYFTCASLIYGFRRRELVVLAVVCVPVF
jgi:hypothetical protein